MCIRDSFIILFYSCYSCSERIQSPFDVLIPTVYLLYVVDAADAVRTHEMCIRDSPVGIENSWVVTAEGVEKLTLFKEEIVEL